MRTIRMLLLSLLAGVPAGAEEFLKLNLSPEWSFYSAPYETFDEVDPAKLTSAPESFGAAKRETVTFRNGRFCRTGRPAKVPGVVVNEFTSDKAGWMLLRCGSSVFRMKVALNGKQLLHVRTSNSRSRFGIPGTHDVPLPVKSDVPFDTGKSKAAILKELKGTADADFIKKAEIILIYNYVTSDSRIHSVVISAKDL